MDNSKETSIFLEKVDSIQRRFMESLITGQRDSIFKEKYPKRSPNSENDSLQAHIDSQRGTF
jgi:hypothetical protein